MNHVVVRLALLLTLGWATDGPVMAQEPRIALVIGNSGYVAIPALANPKNDAALIGGALRDVGFDVALITDADRATMAREIAAFGRRLESAGRGAVGLFYFAGHGVEAAGINYLLPIGGAIQTEADLYGEAISASWVLGQMEYAANDLNIIVLDACRNNPFKRSFRAVSNGLARMDAPRGSLLAYAAAPGQLAEDGLGANSTYSLALANAIATPGLKLEDVFKQVRVKVETVTQIGQTPWEESSLRGDFYFIAPEVNITINPTPPPAGPSDDALYWQSIKDSDDPALYALYLEQFPDGTFADLARYKLDNLRPTADEKAAPSPPRAGPVTVAQTSRYLGQDDAGDGRWAWEIHLEDTAASLDQVRNVTYYLHPTFPNPRRQVSDRASGFQLETSGWGTFMVELDIQFADGRVERRHHQLVFDTER